MEVALPIILFVGGFVVGGFVVWQMKQRELEDRRRSEEELESAFGNLSRQALTENQTQFLELARGEFQKLEKHSGEQLNQKKELIDTSLQNITTSILQLNQGTARLHGQVESSTKRIENLTETTNQLRQILSSSQARGQWGERMVEDILNLLGMLEGKNYDKQTTEGSDRPDFTFHLPKGKRLNMDVKFPITHYEQFLSTEDEPTRAAEKKQFLADIRGHVKAVSGRSYIDPAGGTVDYVLLFIPNESIYSFINQEDHELMDFALERRIVLCSPLTLYAILSLIRQSVASFAVEQRAGDLQQLVQKFSEQWVKYNEKVESVGKSLANTQKHFDDLNSTRTKALERPMDKIIGLNLEDSATVETEDSE
tara:strand:- start:2909 stop:4009 length:1101 start_codon:yes stop_codon:yes gene_type:complete